MPYSSGTYRARDRGRHWDRHRHRDRVAGDRGRGARDRGQVAIEYLGFLPILIIVAMAAVQLGLIAYTAQQAGTAARAGARSASLDEGAGQACAAAVSDWLADGTDCGTAAGGDEVTVTATVDIPSIVPGWDFGNATKTATMPIDH
ncbi:TadE/TadG family type IV pilus assembly protein [Streptomyces mutabilis]|uniref:TadE/TadG family type IV pilus assembly protein n=1 Tax=Streptomyces TaxID=1883 RepID=UPI00211BFFE3|nr:MULTISPECIES: TadE/TadG family type IV pilus assembly protein [unclassified Streptomyces]MDN3247648.1 TadE/TadG family type IV pilus assembly protein [Streptomyces sp. ZSW22]MDN3252100.1 TadE/TadG family type IV pilus assembly protein [Streptomyces sp. MA25(2023)]